MKLVRANDEKLVFRLSQMEKEVFVDVVTLYPQVPAGHQPISKSMSGLEVEDQQLLDAALAEQRAGNRAKIRTWLEGAGRFKRVKSGCSFTVLREDVDWLLQVLNDIRVGSWLLLGSPEEPLEPDEMDPGLHRTWAAMEVSGHFQMALLHALEFQSPD